MVITVNGKPHELGKPVSVRQLLSEDYVEMQEYVTVQLNEEIVERDRYDDTTVNDGDVVEFLYYMGGGCR